jgi:hypothetical protein
VFNPISVWTFTQLQLLHETIRLQGHIMDFTSSLTKVAIGVFVLGGFVTLLNQNYEMIFHGGQKTSMTQVLSLVPVSRNRVTFAVKSGINTCARDLVAPRPDSIILAVISAPILDVLSLPAVAKGETPTEEAIDASRARVMGRIVKDMEARLQNASSQRQVTVEQQMRKLNKEIGGPAMLGCVFDHALERLKDEGLAT